MAELEALEAAEKAAEPVIKSIPASISVKELAEVLGKKGSDLVMALKMCIRDRGISYGFAVNKCENAELLEIFNAGLANLKESGKYDEILNTYIQE